MTDSAWTDLDRYIADTFGQEDAALRAAVDANRQAGLPPIEVSAPQGALLHVLARSQRPSAILEIGTLGGYSTIWLARALEPGGRLVTLEVDPRHAEVARANIERAGLSGSVELRLGPALATLPALEAEGCGPFDFVFIDADKEPYAEYFEWAVRLSRPGTLVFADNVVRNGAVLDEASEDPLVLGARRFNERVAAEDRVVATEIQTVGVKGYDGFALAVVEG